MDSERNKKGTTGSGHYYADAKMLAALLSQEGEAEVAEYIRAVMEGGSSATEILMGLRHWCQQALDQGRAGKQTTRARIKEFVKALESVLS